MVTAIAKPASLAASVLPGTGAGRLAGLAIMALAGSFLLWVSAKTHVPFFPVPMTLQTLAVMVLAATLGTRLGLAALALYFLEGAFGLPVFSGTPERGIGLAYMAGPTAGYLAGFVVTTVLVGWVAERGGDRSALRLFPAMLAGGAATLALGYAWLAFLFGPETALATGVVPFIPGDAVKIAIAALFVPAAGRLLRPS